MADDYLIFNLSTGEVVETTSKKIGPEAALKNAYEKHVGGKLPEMTFGLVTVACGNLCLMK